jgi:hypothetical protein
MRSRSSSFPGNYRVAFERLQRLLTLPAYHDTDLTAEWFLVDDGAWIDLTKTISAICWGILGTDLCLEPRSIAIPLAHGREGHLFEEWMPDAALSLRSISVGTSEADCEHNLSVQREIVGAHGPIPKPVPFRLGFRSTLMLFHFINNDACCNVRLTVRLKTKVIAIVFPQPHRRMKTIILTALVSD